MYNNDLGFDDEPLDMTTPGSNRYNRNYQTQRFNDDIKIKDEPLITKITRVLVVIAMFAVVGLFAYFISLGDFDIDKKMKLIKFGFLPVYVIFILDSLVMTAYNKRVSLFFVSLVLPVFYPVFRSRVTYDRTNLYTLWTIGIFVLAGAVVNNVYPQINEKFLLVKGMSDEYPAECDDAVKYLKGIKLDSGKMIIEVVHDKFDDYVWDAEKKSDNTYEITVTGDTDMYVGSLGVSADKMLNDNTKFTFLVYDNMTKYTVTSFTFNKQEHPECVKEAWEEICKQ